MPRILVKVRERAVAEARRRMLENGGEELTVRGVAAALGVAPGTLYNYFPSKDHLAASAMLEDWQEMTEELKGRLPAASPEEGLKEIFDGIRRFSERYGPVWDRCRARMTVPPEETPYHARLIAQVRALYEPLLPALPEDEDLRDFAAETLLHFASQGRVPYEKIGGALSKLLDIGTEE